MSAVPTDSGADAKPKAASRRGRGLLLGLSGVGVAIALLAIAILSLPLWINTQLVKHEVISLLERALPGTVRYANVRTGLFPHPHLSVMDVQWATAGGDAVRAEALEAEVEWLPLLRGAVRVRLIRVIRPTVTLDLAGNASAGAAPTPAQVDAQLRQVLAQFDRIAPELRLDIERGELALRHSRGIVNVREVDARVESRSGRTTLQIKASTDVTGALQADMAISGSTLEGGGSLELPDLALGRVKPLLPEAAASAVPEARIRLALKWTMRGASQWKVAVDAGSDRIVLPGPPPAAPLDGVRLHGTVAFAQDAYDVAVDTLSVAAPELMLAGRLRQTPSGWNLRADAKQIDVVQAWPVAVWAYPPLERLARAYAVPLQGRLEDVTLESGPAALANLFDVERLAVSGAVAGAGVRLPGQEVEFKDVAGKVRFAGNRLTAEGVRGASGPSRVLDGSLAMSFQDPTPTLEATAQVSADLAQVLAILKRNLTAPSIQKQLQQIRRLEGRALVQVALAGPVSAPALRLAVSEPRIAFQHADLPFPVSITGGVARYADRALSAERLAGTFGSSTVSGLTGRMRVADGAEIHLSAGRADVALPELFAWLVKQPAVAAALEGVKVDAGRASVEVKALDGSLQAPARLTYSATVAPQNLVLRMRELPQPLQVSGGVLQITSTGLRLDDVGIGELGAALRIGGVGHRIDGGMQLDRLTAKGVISPALGAWVHQRFALPPELRVSVPMQVDSLVLVPKAGGGLDASGAIVSATGTRLEFDVQGAGGGRILARRIAIRDQESDATLSATVQGEHAKGSFAGRLARASVQRLLPDLELLVGAVRGELAFDIDRSNLGKSRGKGTIVAEHISPPVAVKVPWLIRSLTVEASDQQLRLKDVRLEGPGTQATIAGTVGVQNDRLMLDLTVAGDALSFDENDPRYGRFSPEVVETSPDTRPWTLRRVLGADLPAWGSVKVDLQRVDIGRFDIAPLKAAGSIENGKLELSVEQAALCSIDVHGTFVATLKHARLDATLTASNAQLENTILCLTEKSVDATGRFDLSATFSSEGDPAALRENLRGGFVGRARDGNILAFDMLNRIFALPNVTQLLRKQVRLAERGLAYDSIHVSGMVSGPKVEISEARLLSSKVTLAAQGKIDYQTEQLRMTVLVAPLTTMDYVVRAIPIVGYILGGSLVAVPVEVSGSLRDPTVVPLGPEAVATRLLDILGRTFKLPINLRQAVIPGAALAPGTGPAPNAAPAPGTVQKP